MFSEIHYNKIQIYVIKIFEMIHPQFYKPLKINGVLKICILKIGEMYIQIILCLFIYIFILILQP